MSDRLDRIRDLREKRARLAQEANEILESAEGGVLSAEAEERFDKLHREIEALGVQIQRMERQRDLEAELNEPREVRTQRGETREVSADEAQAAERRYSEAFGRQLRGRATAEDRQILEQRALGTIGGTPEGAAGGYTVPEDFYRQLIEAQLAYGGMREVANVFATADGAKLPIPTSDDTSNKGAIIDENPTAAIGEQDTTFGQVILGAYTYTSKVVRVSLQLLQDSAFNIESHLAEILGIRIVRATNEHFTTGDGTNKPLGILASSTEGKKGAAGQVTSVTVDDLVDLEHSVDPAYRRGARFMFHDSTLKALKKLKDQEGRPIWLPGVAVREPDTILGYGYTVNQDMPVMAAKAKSIVFGDLRKYFIRDVLGVQLVIMREKWADYLQVGFLAYSRHDGVLVDAGTHPVKHYANPAT